MNMLLTSLDLLVIVFMVLASVSLLALSLMFLVRNPRIKKVCFYIYDRGNFLKLYSQCTVFFDLLLCIILFHIRVVR